MASPDSRNAELELEPEPEPDYHVLALNSGSSSLKFGLYRVGPLQAEVMLSGEADAIGDEKGTFCARDSRQNKLISETVWFASQREAFVRIAKLLAESDLPVPSAVGHRIVHGGARLRQHCVIDDWVVRQLAAAVSFAPLHIPSALSVIQFAQEHFPGIPQVACFDTTFHAELAEVARVLPVPRELQAEGIQRYGFHGLSCESIVHQLVHQLAHNLPKRLVIAHLGNGASVTAVRDGKSIDTSMGLTPTGGVMMGTRSGDLDPGVLIYLMREKKFDVAALEEMVDHRSGLLGVSGIGSDMRRLREAASVNADARLAVQMFCYAVRKQVAAMIAALDGVDLIVFTGGIGENDWESRAEICLGLSWIGVTLDQARNRSANKPISDALQNTLQNTIHDPASRCAVLVLASEEDEQIARHTWTILHPE
ncbi:acetate/propionate family kinase [Glaciimonas immobilis]|uniref:Acetate kinase n=1 Tax=Glaciimonas immobilis TaxID=728004 RepID=A0A840RUS6_9BURK|nr:acetate/propionate family kinase [Glaciimonas immobilis]KAF3997651.1 acetate/propionate family kinase [Glaciimonas immobilis]MBB5200636.1 acetate kinase [Glaciimonas immobilis]